jgi:anti-sigma factor RsiW
LKSGDLDKRLSAYQDGALADSKRDRLQRDIERDPALQKQLKRSQALSSLVREAWTEGPAAPPPELLIAALRPQLAAIARERRERPAFARALEQARLRLARWVGPMPLLTSAAAAFLLALVLLPNTNDPNSSLSASLHFAQRAVETQPAPLPRARVSTTPFMFPRVPFAPASLSQNAAAGVYDLSPGERPAMIFQNDDGSTMLWLLEDDDLSLLQERIGRWG